MIIVVLLFECAQPEIHFLKHLPAIGVNLGMPGSSDTAGVDAAAIIAGLLVVFLFLAWYSFGRLTSFVPKVEKSKCSGCKTVSPVFSKKALKILKKC